MEQPQQTLWPTLNPDPAFDERGIGRYGDVDLMAQTAINLMRSGEKNAATLCVLLPGVMDRLIQLPEWEEVLALWD